MQYAMMIYAEPGYAERLPDSEREAVLAEFTALLEDTHCVAAAYDTISPRSRCVAISEL